MAKLKPIDRFFSYARERHNIYLRRAEGKPKPWTKDPVLAMYRFTNVFRELDKTTLWFRKNVRDKLQNEPSVLLATVLFRMLNRIEVGEAIFNQTTFGPEGVGTATAWDYYLIHRNIPLVGGAVRTFVGPKGPYVTGAYIISTPPGKSKLDGALGIVDEFAHRMCEKDHCGKPAWECAARDMIDRPGEATLERTFEWLSTFPYLGHFHSYEIVTDLRHTALLRRAPDINTWANMGPGAQRGLNRIHGRGREGAGRNAWGAPIAKTQALEEMRAILRLSRDATNWPQGHKRTAEGARTALEWPKWELRDVEHTLCEFDKYERTVGGEGRPRGRI